MISQTIVHPFWGLDYRSASIVFTILIVAFFQFWNQGKLGARSIILFGLGFGLMFAKGFYVWIFAGPILLLRLSALSGSAGWWGPFFGEFLLIAGIVLPGQQLWVRISRIYLLAAGILGLASAYDKKDSRGFEYGVLPLILIAGVGLMEAGPSLLLGWVAAGFSVYMFMRGKSAGPVIGFASAAVIFGQGPVIGLGSLLLFYTSDLLSSKGVLGRVASLGLWIAGIGMAMPNGSLGHWSPWVILSLFVPSIYLSGVSHSDDTKSKLLTGASALGALILVLTSGLIRQALFEFILEPKSLVVLAAIFAVPLVLAIKNSLADKDPLPGFFEPVMEIFGRKNFFAGPYNSVAFKQAKGFWDFVSGSIYRRLITLVQQLLSLTRLRNASNNFSQSLNHQAFVEILFLVGMIFIGLS